MTTPEQEAIRVAASQHGLIERAHAQSLGMTEKQLQELQEHGRWTPIRPGVYVVGGAPITKRLRLLAACLAAGHGAVVSHRAAAWLWGLDGFDRSENGPLEVTVAYGRGPALHEVIVHHSQRFDPEDRTFTQGIPVTTRERTLLDLGAVVPPGMVETAIEGYLRSGGTLTKLQRRLDAVGGRGCRGVGVARAILDGRDTSRPLGSALEVRYRRLVTQYGYWPGIAQYEVRLPRGDRIFIDRAYPEAMVAVELDGYRDHSGRIAFQRDHERYTLLTRIRWRHLLFTSEDVFRRPDYVIGSLLDTVPLPVLLRSATA